MVDAVGTTGFEYHPGGLLAKEDGPWSSDSVTNGYSKRLRHGMGLQQPTGWWTNKFVYDLARRLTNVASPAGTFSYTHTNVGPGLLAGALIQKIALPGSQSITNDFDALGRLKATLLKKSDGTTNASATYGLNAGNQRTWFTNAGTYVGYTYDNIGQLKVADSSTASEDRGYTYDTAWNLNYRTNNGTLQTFSVDGENQLSSAPDGTCAYDSNGNLTSAKNGKLTLDYDAENQLLEAVNYDPLIEERPTTATTFVYDGMNRLRLRREWQWEQSIWEDLPSGNGTWLLLAETRYLYDGWRVVQERDSNNVPAVAYTRGTDLSGSLEGAGGIGGLLARSHGYSSGTWSTHNYYFADGNGNILNLVNSSGTLQASYRYDAYGNLLSSSGSLAAANGYRFSSKEWMGTAGLYYYGYRFYSPNWQRWLNRDPIGERGDNNLFRAVRNEPTGNYDRLGLDAGKGGPYEPTPGPKPIDGKWDRDEKSNNCYNYALDFKCPEQVSSYVQPGQLVPGNRMQLPASWTCDELKKRVRHDGALDPDKNGNCPDGWHKIRLWANNGGDFHFYRQNNSGTWTHKPGQQPYTSCPDENTYNNYNNCGDLCVVNR